MLRSLLDGSVFAERTGTVAPTVLALHGWGRTRVDLMPVVEDAAALVPDLPGFGSSPPPPQAWGSAEYAGLLAPLLDDGEPWTVLGHSFGGRVAVQLAHLRPDRVARLVLTGVPLLKTQPSAPPLGFRITRALHRRHLVSDARMERLRQQRGSADYRAASGVTRDTLVRLVREDYADLLPAITSRVELVWGAGDTAAPLSMAERAATLFPDAHLTVSQRSGHLLDADLVALLRQRLSPAVGDHTSTQADR